MNKLFQQMNTQSFLANSNTDKIRQAMNMMKTAGNPQQTLAQLAQNNPQAKQVLEALQNGADPKSLFYQTADKLGIDPNEVLNMMR